MFPEFAPEKAMWVIAALATVAVFVTRAHADVALQVAPAPTVHASVGSAAVASLTRLENAR